MTPEPQERHDNNKRRWGLHFARFNATKSDQLRFVGSARADYFQIPNAADQQLIGVRDIQRERDVFGNLSWVPHRQAGHSHYARAVLPLESLRYDGYDRPDPSLPRAARIHGSFQRSPLTSL